MNRPLKILTRDLTIVNISAPKRDIIFSLVTSFVFLLVIHILIAISLAGAVLSRALGISCF